MNESELATLDLAVALAVTRTKPSDLSIREYILELRNHIHPGRRPQFSASYEESQQNYINAALYFQSKLKESEKQNENLMNTVAALEKQIAALGKAPSHDIWPVQKPKKKRKRSPHRGDGLVCEDLEEYVERIAQGFQVVAKDDHSRTLLRRLFELQKALREASNYASKQKMAICRTCSSFKQVMCSTVTEATHDCQESARTLRSLLPVLSLIFSSFERLNSRAPEYESNATTEDRQDSDSTPTYAILVLFKAILDSFRDHSTKPSSKDTQSDQQARISERSSQQNPEVLSSAPNAPLAALKSLSHAYITLLLKHHSEAETSKAQQAYAELLEGTVYVLLTRAGELMYTLTFGAKRKASLAAEISSVTTSSDDPGPAKSASKRRRQQTTNGNTNPKSGATDLSTPDAKESNELRGANLEARHITPLLELILPRFSVASPNRDAAKAQNTEPNAFGGTTDRSAPPSKAAKRANGDALDLSDSQAHSRVAQDSARPLSEKPLRILQNTLLAGVFGPASCKESYLDERVFGETLNLPFDIADEPMDFRVDESEDEGEGEARSWFLKRMWELVGWDVLAGSFKDQAVSRNEEETR